MDLATQLSQNIAELLDLPLGWLLALPRDVTLILVALLTSLLLILVRKWTTHQDRLHRTRRDLARLKSLLKTAKRARDKPAVQRLRATVTAVRWIQLQAEGVVLLAALIPVALLATWAVERLDYLPPRAGLPLHLRAFFAPAAVNSLTVLVPQPGMRLVSPAIQLVQLDSSNGENGTAAWVIRPQATSGTIELLIRRGDETARHRLRVGEWTYEPPVQSHAGQCILVTQAELPRYRFLGLIPALAFPGVRPLGLPPFTLAPWLVAYLVLTIPLVPLLRRLTGVG
jgi:hypothetical protein